MTTPSALPNSAALKSIMRSAAVCDTILTSEKEIRYFAFDTKWGKDELGTVKNGSGDELFVLFNAEGAFLKGFAHEFEAPAAPAEFYMDAPRAFAGGVTEAAFSPENVSYCFWREIDDGAWQSSVSEARLDPGVFALLKGLGGAEAYRTHAADYFEVTIEPELTASIFYGQTISKEIAKAMNPDVDLDALRLELDAMDVPTADF